MVRRYGWLRLLQEKDSSEIYEYLKKQNLLEMSEEYWWPNAGSFEVVIESILAQNTSWKNVEKSLENLDGFLELQSFLTLSEESIKERIKPSGFYNQKAPRLFQLAKNISEAFQTFENFQNKVSREWLLAQKGIGEESADSILCYACFREEMVVDTYTKRLLKKFGVEFKKYAQYKEFLERGMREKYHESLNLHYARFHGMIVEYNKNL